MKVIFSKTFLYNGLQTHTKSRLFCRPTIQNKNKKQAEKSVCFLFNSAKLPFKLIFKPLFTLRIKVARNEMSVAVIFKFGFDLSANIHTFAATSVEFTPFRRVCGRRNISF